jgi:hypothetical protein
MISLSLVHRLSDEASAKIKSRVTTTRELILLLNSVACQTKLSVLLRPVPFWFRASADKLSYFYSDSEVWWARRELNPHDLTATGF